MDKDIITTQISAETQDVDQILASAKIVIKTEDDRLKASEIIVSLKKKYDTLEENRTSLVKPLNDHVKFINAQFKPFTEKLDSGISALKRGVANYLLEEERKAKEKEEKELAKLKAKNEKREAEGKAPIIKTIESAERPASVAHTQGGKTGGRKVWKFEVIDSSLVPAEFLSPDVDKIKQAVANGSREIAGVKIYEDIIISASAY